MERTITLLAGSLFVAGLALALPTGAAAQGQGAGVVTTLQGSASVSRVSTAQPGPQLLPLKFRDEVFLRDRITTGEQSLARILLGGKAVVTVREHSSLTITETASTSTITLSAGKIALAVAKERMRSNERIDITTPNAVAGVRGTVLIIEVGRATAQAGGGTPGGITSRFILLSGLVDVGVLDPATGRPGTAQFTLNARQTLSVTGFTPPAGPRDITQAEAQAAAADYKVDLKDVPQPANAQVSQRQLELATNAAAATASNGGTASGSQLIDRSVQSLNGGVLDRVNGDEVKQRNVVIITPPPPPPPPSRVITLPPPICSQCEIPPSGPGALRRR